MDFLLNNPAIAFIFLLVSAFTILMVIKIVMEVNLNKLLKLKHRKMRINMPETYVKSRIVWLSLGTVTPTILIVMMFSIGINQNYDYQNTTSQITSASDIQNIFDQFSDQQDINYINFNIRTFNSVDSVMESGFMGVADESGSLYDTVYGSSGDYTGSDDYSGTNNQVVGVDEMDSVLTDGLNIYTYFNDIVTVARAFTTEQEYEALEVIKVISYSDEVCENEIFIPNGMYVDDDYLVVVGYYTINYLCDTPTVDEGYMLIWNYNTGTTGVKVYDKDEFNLIDEYEFEGSFKGTRKVENNLFIITSQYLPYSEIDFDIEDNIPEYTIDGDTVTVDYSDISYVDGTAPNSFTSFYGIDLDTHDIDVEVILGDNGYNIYMSNENIYIEGIIYNYLPMSDFINFEDPYSTRTAINKISVLGNDLTFVGTGFVDGRTIDQFSLDEFNGYLRVVTSEGWGSEIVNRITILDEDMNFASVIDSGLGEEGERVMSMRFVGNYGYVVTYLQMDPFYTIDLSDPYHPEIIGALKIPGFSSYLQPLNDDYMFGIGFTDERTIKLDIYDISDKEKPVVAWSIELDDDEYGYGWSEAAYDHKALLLDIDKGIISIPFASWGYDDDLGFLNNSGALVFNIDLDTGFEFNGFVSHSFTTEYDIYGYKSEYIDNYFYVVTNKYISVSTIEDTELILEYIRINE